MRTVGALILLAAVGFPARSEPGGEAGRPGESRFPGRWISLPREQVFDTFLGYFTGLVTADAVGYADSAYMRELMPEFDSFLSLPFEEIRVVRRERVAGHVTVTVAFRGPIRLPIPFRILWDTPGEIRASATVLFSERRLDRVAAPGGVLQPVYVYDVRAGEVRIDFDRWLDVLLGRAVDDLAIRRILLFRLDGGWTIGLLGRGYEGQLIAGYFDLAGNRILVPVPRRLRGVEEILGAELE